MKSSEAKATVITRASRRSRKRKAMPSRARGVRSPSPSQPAPARRRRRATRRAAARAEAEVAGGLDVPVGFLNPVLAGKRRHQRELERHDRHPVPQRREPHRPGDQPKVPIPKQAGLHRREHKAVPRSKRDYSGGRGESSRRWALSPGWASGRAVKGIRSSGICRRTKSRLSHATPLRRQSAVARLKQRRRNASSATDRNAKASDVHEVLHSKHVETS
jgi:hypothetical protein